MTVSSYKLTQARINVLLAVCSVSILVLLFPTLEIIENSNLTVRMVEEILLFVYAVLLGYGLQKYAILRPRRERVGYLARALSIVSRINQSTKGIFFAFLLPALPLVYWNFPANFDLTAQNIYVRYASDLSNLVVALLVGAAITYIPHKFRVILLYFAFMTVGMMGSMMIVWSPGFYAAYSSSQNATMDTFMMLFGAFGVVGTSSWLVKVMDIF